MISQICNIINHDISCDGLVRHEISTSDYLVHCIRLFEIAVISHAGIYIVVILYM